MKNYIVINTPSGKTVYTKDLMIIPGIKIHMLSANIADRVLDLFDGLNLSECMFPERVNELIGQYSLNQRETTYNLLYLAMLDVTRPNAVITGGDDIALLY